MREQTLLKEIKELKQELLLGGRETILSEAGASSASDIGSSSAARLDQSVGNRSGGLGVSPMAVREKGGKRRG